MLAIASHYLSNTWVDQGGSLTKDFHTKNQGRRSNGSDVRAQTEGQKDRQTDGWTLLPSTFPPCFAMVRGR